jgi:hypothetical protein
VGGERGGEGRGTRRGGEKRSIKGSYSSEEAGVNRGECEEERFEGGVGGGSGG